MTMDVDVIQPLGVEAEQINKDQILEYLTNISDICFKSQQRGEDDLTKQQKFSIASEIFDNSKLNFLLRFGKYLQENQLNFFTKFDSDEGDIGIVLKDLLNSVSKDDQKNIKNRRYEALKHMIDDENYFSETEMMKRNPLLYEQLVGQYLTEEEKMEIHRIKIDGDQTLVKVLMEGIERDDAKSKKEAQEQVEMEMTDDDEDAAHTSDDDDMSQHYTQWGEFEEDTKKIKIKKNKVDHISLEEQRLLKEEFISTMYENFLNGKDEDFDYSSVDNNEKYDNHAMVEYDEEDKYFDSEEPNDDPMVAQNIESDDELDTFMSVLNHRNPEVSNLSKKMENL